MVDELTADQIAELIAALHALHTDLSARTENSDRTATVTLDQTAVGRISRVDALQQQAMAKAEVVRHGQRLKRVSGALVRVDMETYGDCLLCGEIIPFRRLQAQPEAPFCVTCAAASGG
jgi:DnaK suppressor protein